MPAAVRICAQRLRESNWALLLGAVGRTMTPNQDDKPLGGGCRCGRLISCVMKRLNRKWFLIRLADLPAAYCNFEFEHVSHLWDRLAIVARPHRFSYSNNPLRC